MTTTFGAGSLVGVPVRRVEDPTLLRGEGTYIDNRNRQIVEDNQRVAEAAQRQRERDEREAAEARKEQEAERAAYHAKHGWPT